MSKLIELTGQTFGRLTVVCRAPNIGGDVAWMCSCACGNTKAVRGSVLRGRTGASCGCLRSIRIHEVNEARRHPGLDCDCPSARFENRRICAACKMRWFNYKITPARFKLMLENQAGLCAVCTEPMRFGGGTHVDHCHRTGRVRALLCGPCNSVLGLAKESALVLQGALAYLEVA